MRNKRLFPVLFSGQDWQDVSVPDAGFSWVPFTIQQNGRVFRPATTFNLRTHANITVTKTYYLNTVSGNDGANGTTPSTPKKTWNNIIGLGDYDCIVIQDGSYLLRSESSAPPTRSCEVIGEGTVYFTSNRVNNLGEWTLAAGQAATFQSTVAGGEFIAQVFDEGTLDADGQPTIYTGKASVAEVEAQAGSRYWVGGVLYVHTLDGLTPSGRTDLRYYDSLALAQQSDSISLYFENIIFRGSVRVRNNSATGGLKAYFKECSIYGMEVAGVDEIIYQDCTSTVSELNYDARNGVVCNVIEADVDTGFCGGSTSDQTSTTHNGCNIVRINGKYHDPAGQCIADSGNGKAWCLGSEMYNSGSGIDFNSSMPSVWLDSCWSHDNSNYDLQNTTGTTIYIHNFIGAKGVNDIGGTLTPY